MCVSIYVQKKDKNKNRLASKKERQSISHTIKDEQPESTHWGRDKERGDSL